MNQEMIQEAEQAAESVRFLRRFRDKPYDEGEFAITGIDLGPWESKDSLPILHIHESTLAQIVPIDQWVWARRECDGYPFRATAELFGVIFLAVFDRLEAIEHGCPQEMLDEAN
jgi:hypothetical protein